MFPLNSHAVLKCPPAGDTVMGVDHPYKPAIEVFDDPAEGIILESGHGSLRHPFLECLGGSGKRNRGGILGHLGIGVPVVKYGPVFGRDAAQTHLLPLPEVSCHSGQSSLCMANTSRLTQEILQILPLGEYAQTMAFQGRWGNYTRIVPGDQALGYEQICFCPFVVDDRGDLGALGIEQFLDIDDHLELIDLALCRSVRETIVAQARGIEVLLGAYDPRPRRLDTA